MTCIPTDAALLRRLSRPARYVELRGPLSVGCIISHAIGRRTRFTPSLLTYSRSDKVGKLPHEYSAPSILTPTLAGAPSESVSTSALNTEETWLTLPDASVSVV